MELLGLPAAALAACARAQDAAPMRAMVFAHFDPHDQIDTHLLFALRSYRPYFDVIVFVSCSDLGPDQRRRAHQFSDTVITRANVGYDFLSWRIGYETLRAR